MRLMKILLATCALAFQASTAADSQINSVEPEVRAELTALVETWIDAEVRGDGKSLEKILHKDFLSTFASGTTLGRASYIDFILSLDIAPFNVKNESMVQDRDTVVVIDVSEDDTTKFTWIAIRRDNQWKVIAQTFSNVEASRGE